MDHILQLSATVDLRLRLEVNSSGSSAELTRVKTERKSNSANRFLTDFFFKVPIEYFFYFEKYRLNFSSF